jgi:hypothetical protein
MIQSPQPAQTELPHDKHEAKSAGKDFSPHRGQRCHSRSIILVVGDAQNCTPPPVFPPPVCHPDCILTPCPIVRDGMYSKAVSRPIPWLAAQRNQLSL